MAEDDRAVVIAHDNGLLGAGLESCLRARLGLPVTSCRLTDAAAFASAVDGARVVVLECPRPEANAAARARIGAVPVVDISDVLTRHEPHGPERDVDGLVAEIRSLLAG